MYLISTIGAMGGDVAPTPWPWELIPGTPKVPPLVIPGGASSGSTWCAPCPLCPKATVTPTGEVISVPAPLEAAPLVVAFFLGAGVALAASYVLARR